MIRKWEISDLSAVMELWLKTNTEAHEFITEKYWSANFDIVKKMLPYADLYVCEQNNIINGFIGLDKGYISGLFVDNSVQSQGIGKQLLDQAKKNYSELTLTVYQKNTKAVRFYQREGFVLKQQQADVNTGEYELVMVWRKNVECS